MALHWLYIEKKKNTGIKATATCANQVNYPDPVFTKKLFWLGDGWHCCMQGSYNKHVDTRLVGRLD